MTRRRGAAPSMFVPKRKRSLDRLAELVRGLTPDRQDAAARFLDDAERREQEGEKPCPTTR